MVNITEKYLEALKTFDDWVIVSEWAIRFGEQHPDLLDKANQEAENQAKETTGLNEIAARISSSISRGAYDNQIEIDTSCDRSVQGSMRTVRAMELEGMRMDVPDVLDLPIYTVSARLNHRPVTTKGMKGSECLWPDRAMKEWIEGVDQLD